MKNFLKIAAFSWCAAQTASAQLDHILAPVAAAAENAPAVETAADQAGKRVRDSGVLTGDDLLPILEKQLSEHFSLAGELKLGFIRPWPALKVAEPDREITITDFPGEGVTSEFTIRFRISSAGRTVSECQIGLRAQLWQEVWLATGRLDRGQALDHSLLTAQKVDVLREHETLLATDADPSAYEVVQSIPAGHPITRHDIVERPLVRKGQIVEVIGNQGLLAVSMKGQALENGGAKALIKMRNLESLRVFTAQVLNENQVQIQF